MSRTTRSHTFQYLRTVVPVTVDPIIPSHTELYQPARVGRTSYPDPSLNHFGSTTRYPVPTHYCTRSTLRQPVCACSEAPSSDQRLDPYLWLLPENPTELAFMPPSIPKRRRTSISSTTPVNSGYLRLPYGVPESAPFGGYALNRESTLAHGSRAHYLPADRFLNPSESFEDRSDRPAGRRCSYQTICGTTATAATSLAFSTCGIRNRSRGQALSQDNRRQHHRRMTYRPYMRPSELSRPNSHHRRTRPLPRPHYREPLEVRRGKAGTLMQQSAIYDRPETRVFTASGAVDSEFGHFSTNILPDYSAPSNPAESICTTRYDPCPTLVTSMPDTLHEANVGQPEMPYPVLNGISPIDVPTAIDFPTDSVNFLNSNQRNTGIAEPSTTLLDSDPLALRTSVAQDELSFTPTLGSVGATESQRDSSEAVAAAVASAAEAVAHAVSAVVSHHRHFSSDFPGQVPVQDSRNSCFSRENETIRSGLGLVDAFTSCIHPVGTSEMTVLPDAFSSNWLTAPSYRPSELLSDWVPNSMEEAVPPQGALHSQESFRESVGTVPVFCPDPLVDSVSYCNPYTTVQPIPVEPPSPLCLQSTALSSVQLVTTPHSYAATIPSLVYPTMPPIAPDVVSLPGSRQTGFLPITAQLNSGTMNLPHTTSISFNNTPYPVRGFEPSGIGGSSAHHPFFTSPLPFSASWSPSLAMRPNSFLEDESYTAMRDAQQLLFIRLRNHRQASYSSPYYPSAMTATAGGSNASVVVSASLGSSSIGRVAAAVTPPLASQHPAFPLPATTMLSHPQLPAFSSGIFTRHLPHTSIQPTSSAAMALAAVAMAAAAALQQQQSIRRFPTNAMSALNTAPAAPTPSIPVPILHAQLYYPTTIPVSHVSSPHCFHSHYATARPPIQPQQYPVSTTQIATSLANNSSGYWTQFAPLLLAVPSANAFLYESPSSYPSTQSMPVGNAVVAVAAAAATVDTLYQLAVHLESNGVSVDSYASRGLSASELDSLPVRTYQTKVTDQSASKTQQTDPSDDRCMICLDDYEAEDKLRQMRCCHEFHAACVDKWLETKRTCPLCRADAFDGSQMKDDLF